MSQTFSSDDLLLGPIDTPALADPHQQSLFLEKQPVALPEGFLLEAPLPSRVFDKSPGTVLAGRGRNLFAGRRRSGPFVSNNSLRPITHTIDEASNSLYFWRAPALTKDGSEESRLFVSDSLARTPRALSQNLSKVAEAPYHKRWSARPFRRGAVFLGAFPLQRGADIFWAEPPAEPDADWELMAARWITSPDPHGFADSLVMTLQGRESIALLGEDISVARVQIEQSAGAFGVDELQEKFYVASWIAREGDELFAKSLRFDQNRSMFGHFGGISQHYLSGTSFQKELRGAERIVPGSRAQTALLIGQMGAHLLSPAEVGQQPKARPGPSWPAGSRVETKVVSDGFLLAWQGEGLRLVHLSERDDWSEQELGVFAEDFLWAGKTLVWIKEGALWATLGARAEKIEEGLPEGLRLAPAAGDNFYLWNEAECSICGIKNRRLGKSGSSRIDENVR